jgi:hypothetical protein
VAVMSGWSVDQGLGWKLDDARMAGPSRPGSTAGANLCSLLECLFLGVSALNDVARQDEGG